MAAAKVFNELGYDKASMRIVAERVGIRQPSLYHHITSKHEILYEIIKTTTQKGVDRNLQIRKMDLPADQKIRLCVKTHFDSLTKSYPQVSVLIHEKISLLPEEMERDIRELYRQYVDIIYDIIQEGVKEGLFRKDTDIKLMAWALMGMINWVYKWGKADGRVSFDRIADFFSDLFLVGVMKQH
ncbi:MAG: TetR/AcrR family transcriptional regulator [Desulfobacteraceae bacterium]|jgi:AcrR family transcriptional regulator